MSDVFNFTCANCGETYYDQNFLCDEDWGAIAGASPDDVDLYLRQNDVFCSQCDDEIEGYLDTREYGRTESELFENSGTDVDEGRRIFLRNNY